MNGDSERGSLPPQRRYGWPYTLAKCALVTAGSGALGAGALWWLLHRLDRPWFIPGPVFRWLVEVVLPYALWVGGAVGVFVGLLFSVGVVAYDARRGRLTRVT